MVRTRKTRVKLPEYVKRACSYALILERVLIWIMAAAQELSGMMFVFMCLSGMFTLNRFNLMTTLEPKTLSKSSFSKAIASLVASIGGKLDPDYHREQYTVPTVRGQLVITPFDERDPWIALRFTAFNGGKVYDKLGGVNFNGWSGKWNIGPHDTRQECLTELMRRLDFVRVK